jgi:hypothetical protein
MKLPDPLTVDSLEAAYATWDVAADPGSCQQTCRVSSSSFL